MYNNRLKRFEKLYEQEFPELVKEYYNEFSKKYTFKYIPLSSIDKSTGKVDLLTFIESYIKDNYKVSYKIEKHFSFHSNSLFYAPTDDFGFSMNVKNKFELPEIILNESKNEYGYINDFGIFSHCFLGIDGLSSVIKQKIKGDLELECELVKLRMKSELKRFFIQGQVDWRWIVLDQIYYYGIDKFPNCLDHEFSQLEYSIGFFEKYGHLGKFDFGINEEGYYIENPTLDLEIRNLQENYYAKLKLKKVSDYTFNDVIEKYLLQRKIAELSSSFKEQNESNEIIFNVNYNALENIPLLVLRDNFSFVKKQWDSDNNYFNYLKYRNSNTDTDAIPFAFPINFKLDLKDVFNDESLIHDYLETYNEPENEIRKMFGLPKIGEGWISETNLFYEIKTRFVKEVVIHHGRPSWLGKQHLDIYMPKFNIGIEYQGDQHYYPIDFFGGEASYIKNIVRDETKKQLCLKNNCHLIYVNPGYILDDIISQIEKIIQ
jgi:hypothetical protein